MYGVLAHLIIQCVFYLGIFFKCFICSYDVREMVWHGVGGFEFKAFPSSALAGLLGLLSLLVFDKLDEVDGVRCSNMDAGDIQNMLLLLVWTNGFSIRALLYDRIWA